MFIGICIAILGAAIITGATSYGAHNMYNAVVNDKSSHPKQYMHSHLISVASFIIGCGMIMAGISTVLVSITN